MLWIRNYKYVRLMRDFSKRHRVDKSKNEILPNIKMQNKLRLKTKASTGNNYCAKTMIVNKIADFN